MNGSSFSASERGTKWVGTLMEWEILWILASSYFYCWHDKWVGKVLKLTATNLPLLIGLRDNPLSRSPVRNIVLLAQGIHHLLALDTEPRFQGVIAIV